MKEKLVPDEARQQFCSFLGSVPPPSKLVEADEALDLALARRCGTTNGLGWRDGQGI